MISSTIESDSGRVPPEQFKARSTCFVVDPSVAAKYQALYSKYECFNKLIYYHKNTCVKHNEYKTPQKGARSTIADKKSPKKTFTMLWNTLNEGNYMKISHRLKFMVNDENYKIVIKELVNMAIIHNMYRKYFIHLLLDVISHSFHEQKDLLRTHAYELMREFTGEYWLLPSTQSNEYDDFCEQQKHKKRVLNTIEFLLDVISVGLYDALHGDETIIDNASRVWNNINETYQTVIDDMFYIDLTLHVIFTILSWVQRKKAKQCNMDSLDKMISSMKMFVQDVQEKQPSMKIQFLCEKVDQALRTLYSSQ